MTRPGTVPPTCRTFLGFADTRKVLPGVSTFLPYLWGHASMTHTTIPSLSFILTIFLPFLTCSTGPLFVVWVPIHAIRCRHPRTLRRLHRSRIPPLRCQPAITDDYCICRCHSYGPSLPYTVTWVPTYRTKHYRYAAPRTATAAGDACILPKHDTSYAARCAAVSGISVSCRVAVPAAGGYTLLPASRWRDACATLATYTHSPCRGGPVFPTLRWRHTYHAHITGRATARSAARLPTTVPAEFHRSISIAVAALLTLCRATFPFGTVSADYGRTIFSYFCRHDVIMMTQAVRPAPL